MKRQEDFEGNLLAHLSRLAGDEAGYDPQEVSQRFGIEKESIIVLSRNENPYGPSPRALEALRDISSSSSSTSLNRYPDSRPLINALSEYTGFDRQNIVAGAGMDEIILTICRIFLGAGDRALIPVPTYSLYGLAAELCAARPLFLERASWLDAGAGIPAGVKMAFICSPNNPTGDVLSEERLRQIVEGTSAIVFLDEAYVEFARKSLIHLVREYENLVIGRTLSKAFGLAGLRLGYALAPEWIANEYRRAAPIFSISSPSIAAGRAALEDKEWMNESVRKIVSERERISEILKLFPSPQGNFLFIQTQTKAEGIAEHLLRQGIIVRDCRSFPGCGEHHLRVTVGRPEENNRFLEELERIEW